MADENLVIDIDEDKTTVVVDKEPAGVDAGVEVLQEQLRTFKEQRDVETARLAQERDAAIAARQTAEEGSKTARENMAQTELSALETAINGTQAEADAAASEYQAALEAGDYKKATDAQRRMAKAEARLVRLEEGKDDLLTRKPEKPVEAPQTQQRSTDPFENAIANVSPRTQAWLRKNPTFVTDPVKNAEANLVDRKAKVAGYIPDSEAYFDFCERELGLKEKAEPEQQTRRTTMPSAPVNRDVSISPTNGSLKPSQVMLTPGEQRVATDGTLVWNYNDDKLGAKKGQPIGLKEMARRKKAMQGEDRYNLNNVTQ